MEWRVQGGAGRQAEFHPVDGTQRWRERWREARAGVTCISGSITGSMVIQMLVGEVPAWLPRSFAIALGLLIGSFLNVVIARLPNDESVVSPGSHCVCGKPIAFYDNIPILSWLLLRARARCCGAAISVRYPLVEAIGGLLAWAIIEVVVLSQPKDAQLVPLLMRGMADLSISLALVSAAFIDLEHMYLPNGITYGFALFAFGTARLRPELGFGPSAVGAVVGFLVVWLPFIVLYKLIRGGPGMGLGDAKLLALVGAWQGVYGVLFALFAGAMQGTVAALLTFAVHGKIEEPASITQERQEAIEAGTPLDPSEDPVAEPPEEGLGRARVPFGPFLILAAIEFLLFGRTFLERWVTSLGAE